MAPILTKSLNRLSKESILDLALRWLEGNHTSTPYLQSNRTGFEADEEDYLHTPAETIGELRKRYHDLKKNVANAAKRDIIDRIVDGDWRRGLSLHQHAMIDFAALEQNVNALRWSALKLVPLEAEEQKLLVGGDSQRPEKRRKLGHHEPETPYPEVSPQAFLSALKQEISPLVKAHYHLHRMPPPYQLTILRLYITPLSAFAPNRSRIPKRAKHATDAGRIMYIALPDSCPYVYISISGSSPSSSRRPKGQKDAKDRMMAKVDMAAMKKIVLEAIPKALSRPHRRWALDTTKLVAKSLKTMCELRGNHKPGTGGGAYSVFTDGEKASEKSPVDVQNSDEENQGDERHCLIEKRFGNMSGEHHAPLDRFHVKLCNAIPIIDHDDGGEGSDPPEGQKGDGDIVLTFSGSDVFLGLKQLAELGSEYIDLDKMPSWMTGELGISSLTV
ncbi:uncharacterized protein Z519_06139 [Cladophialophora bantiana CBS 173.52]|uniref:CHL4 family chromosome segregation protein n=1 Tax=Cladophialophora bantiana (strain ATCC 10958 / CBS 173.52 / CDC B-1940 / NIH 8579) TaxID=1442370 RepID=A0A0D2I9T4_CLAB1|nr:uncharacterized protein Z519_06139 [Cladophialophora bantiana CBS 173.52]KIW93534.1 hypothetical protein Z519_06139 [Cladophialophora bantiana CBS 173.52]